MLPVLYHAHHSRQEEDLSFWSDLASRQGDPILELGCGTGRILVPLLKAGNIIYGLDNDFGMLRFLRGSLPAELKSSVGVYQADMTAFHIKLAFSLIMIPCNTYSTLTSAARALVLEGARRHLLPIGIFAVSIPNPLFLRNLPASSETELEDDFLHPQTGDPVQVSSAWQRTAQQFRLKWYYDLLQPNGQVRRLQVETNHFLVQVSTYLSEFETAGLSVVDMLGDYDGSAFTEEAPFLILLARRKN